MLIPCESCQSTFQLDSNLVKPAGTKVRCSKCQHVFRISPPSVVNRRKHKRIKTQNLISYFAYNDKGELNSHGLGIALDISKGGLLFETPKIIEANSLILLATDREKNFIELKGKLKYSKVSNNKTYLCGIEFIDNDENVIDFITKLIKDYNAQKSNFFITQKKQFYRTNILSNQQFHATTNRKSQIPNHHPTKAIKPVDDFREVAKKKDADYAELPDLPEIEKIVDSILDEKDYLGNLSPHIQAKCSLSEDLNFSAE